MKFQFEIMSASLRCFSSLSVRMKVHILCALQRCGLLPQETWRPFLSNSVTFARNKNTAPAFSGWNKNSSKWVKYEKVTVFSSPLLILNGSPWPKWGWMWAEGDSLVWAAVSQHAKGKTRAKETRGVVLEDWTCWGLDTPLWGIHRIQL